MIETVELGTHTYKITPQRIGYLLNRLGPQLQEVLEAEIDGVDGPAMLGAKAHGVLAVFIPDLMPLHEFLGYGSEAAMLAKEYVEENDKSPDPLEVEAAFEAASKANGGEVLAHLKALLGPDLTQKAVAFLVARGSELTRGGSTSPTPEPSPTSPPTSGESGPTSSGTTPPPSEESSAG